jgi:protein TonB
MSWIWNKAVVSFLVAVFAHIGLLTILFMNNPPQREPLLRRPPVKIRVLNSAPVPQPEPQVLPKPKPPPQSSLKPNKVTRAEIKSVQSLPLVQAEPPVQPQPDKSPPMRKFSVALEATVSTGAVEVPVSPDGSGRAGDPKAEPRLPENAQGAVDGKVRGGEAQTFEAAEVTRPPRLLSQPSMADMRALYPEAARRDNLEGNVSLRLRVSAKGEVVEVRVVRKAGQGFDEVAVGLVKQFRFMPGEIKGQPVEVWIPWIYRFRLDG